MKSLVVSRWSLAIKDLLLCLFSAILLILSYPIFNVEIFAWFAFVPLFFALKDKNLKQAFFLSYLCGLVFFTITIYWLIHVTLAGLILLVLYLAVYFGIFGLSVRFYQLRFTLPYRQAGNYQLLLIPSTWILLEYIRSKLFTGFPWALLGYSQYLNLPVIQIADITGVWGVSFLVMMVNVAVYLVASRWSLDCARDGSPFDKLRANAERSRMHSRGGELVEPSLVAGHKCLIVNGAKKCISAILCLFFVLIYGFYKLHKLPITDYRLPITISIIQGNIPQYQKWDEDFREDIMGRYETLTKEAAKDNPDLIIWPETSVPGVIGEEPELLERVLKLAKEVRIPVLVGAVTSIRYPLNAIRYHNSALLISSDGEILEQYNKLHLVPFGEFVPLEKYFPRLRDLIGVPIGDFTAGEEHTIFKLPITNYRLPITFGVLICFEDIFPGMSKRFVKNGAEFLVNVTNDAWFMKSSAPYQHAQASVFRAVENRVPVVRAANTGLSCFIDKTGRIYDKVSVGKKDIFVVGYETAEVMVKNDR